MFAERGEIAALRRGPCASAVGKTLVTQAVRRPACEQPTVARKARGRPAPHDDDVERVVGDRIGRAVGLRSRVGGGGVASFAMVSGTPSEQGRDG